MTLAKSYRAVPEDFCDRSLTRHATAGHSNQVAMAGQNAANAGHAIGPARSEDVHT